VTNQIQHIAVVGAGYMGGGIAQVLAMAGFDVVIVDADSNLTRRHLDRLGREAEDFEAQGLFEAGSADRVRANLRAADNLPEAVAEADLIEEAVLERPEIKGPVLKRPGSANRVPQHRLRQARSAPPRAGAGPPLTTRAATTLETVHSPRRRDP
jgi:3-hydroxybutyryl-CoA dehydrogenase